MGKAQRTKGAVYEREIAQQFTDVLSLPDVEFKRNIGQARDGGNDIDVGPLVVECKRRKSLTGLYQWVEQAEAAAMERWRAEPGEPAYPCVILREDDNESLVLMKLEDFLTLCKEQLSDAILARGR